MSLRCLVTQFVLLSAIFYGKADLDPLSAVFNKCCDGGKNWFYASKTNYCYSIPQPQIISNLDSLSVSQNNDHLVRKCVRKLKLNYILGQ